MNASKFSVNGRDYVMPGKPVVVICIDGSEPDYHVKAIEAGLMPWLEKVLDGGGSSWPVVAVAQADCNP